MTTDDDLPPELAPFGPVRDMDSKVIQIAAHPIQGLWALCEEGSIWFQEHPHEPWKMQRGARAIDRLRTRNGSR